MTTTSRPAPARPRAFIDVEGPIRRIERDAQQKLDARIRLLNPEYSRRQTVESMRSQGEALGEAWGSALAALSAFSQAFTAGMERALGTAEGNIR